VCIWKGTHLVRCNVQQLAAALKCPLHLPRQVGASNELPESEELDALYDRFLIRRQVAQVSAAQLSTLARIAAGGRLQEIVPGAEQAPAKAGELTMDDYRSAPVALCGGQAVMGGMVQLCCVCPLLSAKPPGLS
jgi:MoxR domain in the MoxR-vWA-beta-propeller ternary systems